MRNLNRILVICSPSDRIEPALMENIIRLRAKASYTIYIFKTEQATSQVATKDRCYLFTPQNKKVNLELINEIIDYGCENPETMIDEIVFCGTETDLEVMGNAIIASGLFGFGDPEIVIISDACRGTSEKTHKKAIKTLQRFGFHILTTDEYINHTLH